MSQRPEPESIDFLLAQICKLRHARAHTLLEGLGLYRGQPRMLWLLWEQTLRIRLWQAVTTTPLVRS